MKLAFRFENVFTDGPLSAEPWQIYLRVVGDFKIAVWGVPIYAEEQFCLVEFAIQSQIWSRAAAQEPRDFVYTSLEAEESGLVWLRQEASGWRIGSVFQESACPESFSLAEIVIALDNYYHRLRRDVDDIYHVDIASLFAWSGVRQGEIHGK
jgi:hypothetical protein